MRIKVALAVLLAGALSAGAGSAYVVKRSLVANISTVRLPAAPGTTAGDGVDDPATVSTGATGQGSSAVGGGPTPGTNVVLIGSDTRQDQGDGFGSFSGARSDTVVLLHLATGRSQAYGLSIPRDLVTRLPLTSPACGSRSADVTQRFNVAFTVGGVTCTVAAVQQLTGVAVDHVLAVDFAGFAKVVDAMGGMQVCLRQAVVDRDANLELPEGVSHIDGAQVLGLVRARHFTTDGSDITRTGRQQHLLRQLGSQAQSGGLLRDPLRLYRVADAASRSLTTDEQLGSLEALVGFARSLADLDEDSVTLQTLAWIPDPRNPRATVVMDPAAAPAQLARLGGRAAPSETSLSISAPPPDDDPAAGASMPKPDAATSNIAGPVFCPVP